MIRTLNITAGEQSASRFTNIDVNGVKYILIPPGGTGSKFWTLKMFSGRWIGTSRVKAWPDAIAWSLKEIEQHQTKTSQS